MKIAEMIFELLSNHRVGDKARFLKDFSTLEIVTPSYTLYEFKDNSKLQVFKEHVEVHGSVSSKAQLLVELNSSREGDWDLALLKVAGEAFGTAVSSEDPFEYRLGDSSTLCIRYNLMRVV